MNNILQNKVLLAVIGVVVAGTAAYGVFTLTQSDGDKEPAGDAAQADTSGSNTIND